MTNILVLINGWYIKKRLISFSNCICNHVHSCLLYYFLLGVWYSYVVKPLRYYDGIGIKKKYNNLLSEGFLNNTNLYIYIL